MIHPKNRDPGVFSFGANVDNIVLERACIRALLEENNDIAELYAIAERADLGGLLRDPLAKWGWQHIKAKSGRTNWIALFAQDARSAAELHDSGDGYTQTATFGEWCEALQEIDARRRLNAALESVRTKPMSEALDDLEHLAAELRSATSNGIESTLDEACWTPAMQPDSAPPVAIFAGSVELRRGNVGQISAKSKSGKSSFVAALVAAMVAGPHGNGDYLGWRSGGGAGAIVTIDTEQSHSDFVELVRGIHDRAGIPFGSCGHRFAAYRLRDVPLASRLPAIEAALRRAVRRVGSVDLLVIDGVADLVSDTNSPEESVELVDVLLRLSTEYATHVIAIQHSNEGANADRSARGWLGKQLMRKSELTICLAKEGDSVKAWTPIHRKRGLSEKEPFHFKWEEDARGFVSLGIGPSLRSLAENQELLELALQLAEGDRFAAWRYSALAQRIVDVTGLSLITAKRRIAALQQHGFLQLMPSTGYYSLGAAVTEAIKTASMP